ncbi:MAG: carbohydrate kinase [Actinomycetes bacterium]
MITVLGEALVDVIVDTDGEVTSVVGGAPLNTARTIVRLGIPATFLGGVSTDSFGRRIKRLLDDDGVTLGLGHQVPEPTTLAIAQIDEGGAATYRFMMEGTSAASVTPEMALEHLSFDCKVIHVGTLGLVLQPLADASVAVVAAANDEQLVMVDPNCRPSVMTGSPVFRSALQAVLARADIVKVSGDDLEFLFPDVDTLDAATMLQIETGAVVLFTDGANAVHVIDTDTDVVLDVPKVPVVDTVGAGDSFSGGFLAYWMHNGLTRDDVHDIDHAVAAARFGIAVAGITCQRPGADPPRSDEIPGGWE